MNPHELLIAAGGLMAGIVITWLLMRNFIASAREEGRAQVQAESAASRERARALEDERRQLQQTLAELRRQADGWRDALDVARDERAQLAERAARLPGLEQDLRLVQEAAAAAGRQIADLREQVGRTESELQSERKERAARMQELAVEKDARSQAEAAASRLQASLSEVHATLEAERAQTRQQLALLQEARTELSNQFKALANDILEEKSKRFAEHNQLSIGQLVAPLKERMTEFKAKVEEIHAKDLEQQAALRAELHQLKELNRQITEEAHGLAVALKGQSKVQGNWGELVLGNVLDRAGLCEGKDYRREVSFQTEEGRRRPDVVLSLPQNRHLVIDAKVSLNAYTRYVNADDPVQREQALREHVGAVASRIQELADRSYFELPGLNTPEMVFMFIPIESAFVEALRADETLFQRAIEHNILVATPTTLLTSLNIVRQLWRFEEQNAHTAELADRAGKVYKKLVAFLASMEAVGKQLDRARESYQQAMGQLVSGKGNLIQQARDFERLGVSVQGQLPPDLVARAALELEQVPLLEREGG
ncbi:MAG TPA: DNA recombination protein RmuC [Ramlibacter sp.]|nr:DNA recombination protein RmuC [Ramlibacter sp.]